MLYKRHNYLNKNIEFIINREIIEYDMKSAGFNLIREFKLLDSDTIGWLETLSKKERSVQVGLIQRKDKSFTKILNEAFVKGRKMFFEANDIKDEDVLSIKKDAILLLRRVDYTTFGHIEFDEKNVYSSYYRLNGYEFYYNPKYLDVKGIGDDMLLLHKEFMLDFLNTFFRLNETSTREIAIQHVLEFSYYYKTKMLEIDYYRELNTQSLFKLNYQGNDNKKIGIRRTEDIDLVDTRYNYMNYVVPLISILS